MPTSLRWGEVAQLAVIPSIRYRTYPANGGVIERVSPNELFHERDPRTDVCGLLGLVVKVSPEGDFVTLIQGNELNKEGTRFEVFDSHGDGKRVVRISIRTGRRDCSFNDEILKATFEIVKPREGELVVDGSKFNKGGLNPKDVDPLPWRGTLPH